MNKSDSIVALSKALAKAQAEMPIVKMNATNPFLKNKYADLGAVIETSRPILAKHGLSIVQTPIGDGSHIGLTTILMHESGEWVENTITLSLGEEKGKSSAQVAGSIISYLRRYSWSSFLGIYADEDTDGNAPKPAPKPAPKQVESTNSIKVKNDLVSDSEWERFVELTKKAVALGVELPQTYERMNATKLNGVTNYINQQIAKKEGK